MISGTTKMQKMAWESNVQAFTNCSKQNILLLFIMKNYNKRRSCDCTNAINEDLQDVDYTRKGLQKNYIYVKWFWDKWQQPVVKFILLYTFVKYKTKYKL